MNQAFHFFLKTRTCLAVYCPASSHRHFPDTLFWKSPPSLGQACSLLGVVRKDAFATLGTSTAVRKAPGKSGIGRFSFPMHPVKMSPPPPLRKKKKKKDNVESQVYVLQLCPFGGPFHSQILGERLCVVFLEFLLALSLSQFSLPPFAAHCKADPSLGSLAYWL